MPRKDARLAHLPKADSFFVPVCLALLLHVVVFAAAFFGWSAQIHIPDRVKPPQIVQARVLAMKPKAPAVAPQPPPPPPPPPPKEDPRKQEEEKKNLEEQKKREEQKKLEEQKKRDEEKRRQRALKKKEEEKKRKERERKKREEEERKRKELERKKKLEEERKQKEEEERRREEEKRKRVAEQKRREEQRRRVEEFLRKQAEAQEFAAQQAETDAQAVAAYQDEIRRLVARYWSRPPSARADMEVTVQIQLVPGGEVIDVLVIQSSGNAAFDRSATNAIRSAGKLPVPEDQRLFDKSFRRFKMRFRPEDLSW